ILKISSEFMSPIGTFDEARHRDTARFTVLTVVFAAHEFQRERGEFPETVEQLVPAYLDQIPTDPLHPQKLPIRYRRESDGTAVPCSGGPNRIDDGGKVDTNVFLDIGYLIKVTQLPDRENGVTEPSK